MNSIKDRKPSAAEIDDEDGVIPGTIFNERQARILKIAVIAMGVMLIVGFALLIGLIAYKASKPRPQPAPIAPAGVEVPRADISGAPVTAVAGVEAPGPVSEIEASIAKGATYVATTMNGDRLVVTLRTPEKDLQLMLFDVRNWRLLGTARLKQGG